MGEKPQVNQNAKSGCLLFDLDPRQPGCISEIGDVMSRVSSSRAATGQAFEINQSTLSSEFSLQPLQSSTPAHTVVASRSHTPTLIHTPLPTLRPTPGQESLLPEAGEVFEQAFNHKVSGGSWLFPMAESAMMTWDSRVALGIPLIDVKNASVWVYFDMGIGLKDERGIAITLSIFSFTEANLGFTTRPIQNEIQDSLALNDFLNRLIFTG